MKNRKICEKNDKQNDMQKTKRGKNHFKWNGMRQKVVQKIRLTKGIYFNLSSAACESFIVHRKTIESDCYQMTGINFARENFETNDAWIKATQEWKTTTVCTCCALLCGCDENAFNQFTSNERTTGSKYCPIICSGKNCLVFKICIAFVAIAGIISLIE